MVSKVIPDVFWQEELCAGDEAGQGEADVECDQVARAGDVSLLVLAVEDDGAEAGEAAEEDVAQLGHGHRGGAGLLGAGQLPGTQAVDHIAQPTANMRFIHF